MLSLLIAWLLAFLIGWVSQRMGMCLVKASALMLKRRPTLFVALVSCGLFGLLLAPLYRYFGINQPLFTPEVGYPLLIVADCYLASPRCSTTVAVSTP